MTHLISEGGPSFMIPLFLLLFATLFFIFKSITNNNRKNREMIKAIGLFALVFGFFSFSIGAIGALDAISQVNDIAPQVLAGGVKVGILPPAFGMFIFLVGRFSILFFTWKQED